MASEETSETRDTPATMTTPSESQRPPAASILHKSSESAGSSSSPQHHVKICGIPPISPRVHKERSKGLHHQHSPKFPARKDRSMSLGAYPPSWRDLGMGGGMTAGGNHFVPLSPYSPSASPLVGTSVYDAAPHPMPFMPNLSHNGPTHAAMEAAVHAERVRRQEKEKEEQNMTADELRAVLKRERSRMSKIQADLAAMRAAAVQSQAEAEVHEEGRINSLMRRVECLQQEKGRIIVELEREEEMVCVAVYRLCLWRNFLSPAVVIIFLITWTVDKYIAEKVG